MQSLFKVVKYSHFFAVKDIQPTGIGILLNFSVRYVQKTFVREGGKSVLKPTRVFGTRIEGGEFRFHIGQYKDFIWYLGHIGISEDIIQVTEEPLYEAKDIVTTINSKYEEREYQTNIINFLTIEEIEDLHSRLVGLQTGGGKAQPLDAFIKVPGSWKQMKDITVGDEIVTKSGEISKVIGTFPQGEENVYKVTFFDGRTTECSGEHLWKVYCPDWTNYGPKILTLNKILQLGSFKRKNLHIDLIDPEETEELVLPIDPYIIGALIGDGMLTRKSCVFLCNPEVFIINEFNKLLPDDLYMKKVHHCRYIIRSNIPTHNSNIVLTELRKLGLIGKYSYNKSIPDLYMDGSISQKLSLLQGLFDTDGSVNDDSTITYTTVSKVLSEQIIYLIRSLGGIATVREHIPKFKYKEELRYGRKAYTIAVRMKQPSSLFRLPRKKNKTNDNWRNSSTLKLRIEKIEYIGKKETKCIAIDHPDQLYITDNFIVTHNTYCATAAASKLGKRTMVIVLPKYIQKWISDAKEILQREPKEILSIQGGKDLKSMLWLSTEQDIEAKFIVISLTTIQNYYNDFKDHGLDIEAMGYPYKPEEMFKHLGIGTLIFDEVHQHLYGVYRVLLHTHVPKVIALSATLISDDHFIDKMQHIMFPKEIRYNKVPVNRYVRVRVYSYGVQDRKTIDKLRTTARGSNTYSHIEYEKSIMKFSPLLNNYLSIVSNILRQNYIDTKEPGDKAIVFAASIAMCNQILHRLKKDYPRLDIRRYVEDDPYENVIEADVRVSTILSAGTAVDIPNLTVAIMTNSVQSPVANLQALGRLRKLKDKEVTFCYIYNYHIKKQTEYHYKKKELFADRAVTIKEFRLDEGL